MMNIFIAKLNPQTTGEDLNEVFSEYGEVISAKVVMDRETGNSKCYGFVEMANDDEATTAIEQLNEATLNGNEIVVKKAKPREERNDRRGGGQRRDQKRPFRPYNRN